MSNPCSFVRRRPLGLLLLLLLLTTITTQSQSAEEDDLMREVLEEDYRNDEDYHGDSHTTPEDQYEKQQKQRAEQEEMLRQKQLLEEERQKQKNAQEREAQFEAELRKSSEEKRKKLKKQKKQDARIVKQVLRAAKHENHYGVLGMRNWEFPVGGRTIEIPFVKKSLTIPGFTLFQITPQKIKRAKRARAMAVHPDKNRDGRANEAFVAVEESASILTDSRQRKEYDQKWRLHQKEQRQKYKAIVVVGVDTLVSSLRKAFAVFKSVLGPFAFPVMILGALLI